MESCPDGKWSGWKVVRMERGSDVKWYGWKVARMGRVVGWEMSFFSRMGNVPMGNSGDPKKALVKEKTHIDHFRSVLTGFDSFRSRSTSIQFMPMASSCHIGASCTIFGHI